MASYVKSSWSRLSRIRDSSFSLSSRARFTVFIISSALSVTSEMMYISVAFRIFSLSSSGGMPLTAPRHKWRGFCAL